MIRYWFYMNYWHGRRLFNTLCLLLRLLFKNLSEKSSRVLDAGKNHWFEFNRNRWPVRAIIMILQKDEYFENKYYAYNLKFFKLIGIWSYDMSPKQLIYICFLNIMIAGGSILQVRLTLIRDYINLWLEQTWDWFPFERPIIKHVQLFGL